VAKWSAVRTTILGSGSQGNCTLFEAAGTRVLVDAGLSLRRVRKRAEEARGEPLDRVDAIVITHAHGDHVAHVKRVARHFDAPVFLRDETQKELDVDGLRVRPYARRGGFRIGALKVRVHPVPHDAPNVALVFDDGSDCVGLVTDLGYVPRGLGRALRNCRTLLLELNHDPQLLAEAPYPPFVRARVGGRSGHLANAQSADLLRELGPGVLERVVCMHLSERNNSAPKALRIAREACGEGIQIYVAKQNQALVLDDAAAQLSLAI